MESIEVELFTDAGNDAVLRLPYRQFPGVLVQGDSLSILRAQVAEVSELCDAGDLAEAREAASLLLSDMDLRLPGRFQSRLILVLLLVTGRCRGGRGDG